MSLASTRLFGLVLALAATAAATLTFDGWPGTDVRTEEFHRLVGGLGFGPALDLQSCEFGFDPRLCPACSADCGPIPGGLFFCPHHASATFDYPPLGPGQ